MRSCNFESLSRWGKGEKYMYVCMYFESHTRRHKIFNDRLSYQGRRHLQTSIEMKFDPILDIN